MSDDDQTHDDETTPPRDDATADAPAQPLAEVIQLGDRVSPPTDPNDDGEQTPRAKTPPRTLLGSLVREIADRLADEARAERSEQHPVLRLLEHNVDETDEDGQGDEVVDLTAERLRRKGPGPSSVDLANVVREGFEDYIDQHAGEMEIEPGGDAGNDDPETASARTVKIDGEFVRRHGANLLPALLNGLAETLGANLAGLAAPPPRPTEASDEDGDAASQDATRDAPPLRAHDPDSEPNRPQTQVKVDLLSVLAALIQPPAAAPDDDDASELHRDDDDDAPRDD